jgi:hypothetical protein
MTTALERQSAKHTQKEISTDEISLQISSVIIESLASLISYVTSGCELDFEFLHEICGSGSARLEQLQHSTQVLDNPVDLHRLAHRLRLELYPSRTIRLLLLTLFVRHG